MPSHKYILWRLTMNKRERLIAYACKEAGDWSRIAEDLRYAKDCTYVSDEPCITIYDEIYPESLRKLRFPPWVLFYRGDISLLKKPSLTIVGSRKMTEYGYRVTVHIADVLKERFVLVSGLAAGIDAAVHSSALAGGRTIGVIGSGLDTQYPSQNRELYEQMQKDHLILSEYPHSVGVRKEHFPWRNRILAALGQCIIVTEARIKSGSMLTVNEAIALSKDIYCVPSLFDFESGKGCNRLISQGAFMLYEMEQLKDIVPEKQENRKI